MTTVAIETLGCKLNQAESEALARELLAAGFCLVSADDGADVYILNSCTVTHVADRKARHLLRAARRRNPVAFLVAAGCYAERAPGEIERMEGVDLVVGADKSLIVSRMASSHKRCDEIAAPASGGLAMTDCRFGRARNDRIGRTRSQVKIQDGCDAFCAYCIVPHVRGRERSVSPDAVLAEVNARVAEGHREVVLTGSRAGSYRSGGTDLERLLRRVLAETGVARVRLSSLQPREITPGLLSLWSDPRLCRHFHLSLQSGSGAVLSRMGREYTTGEYGEAVSAIRARVPGVAITTDVIAGFPGETAEEFEAGYGFCQRMAFAGIHVFPYSRRPGTPAAGMAGQVPEKVKRRRTDALLRLAVESAGRFREGFVGQEAGVLWESDEGGLCSGLTDNYIRVVAPARAVAVNEIVSVRLVSQGEGCLEGAT